MQYNYRKLNCPICGFSIQKRELRNHSAFNNISSIIKIVIDENSSSNSIGNFIERDLITMNETSIFNSELLFQKQKNLMKKIQIKENMNEPRKKNLIIIRNNSKSNLYSTEKNISQNISTNASVLSKSVFFNSEFRSK